MGGRDAQGISIVSVVLSSVYAIGWYEGINHVDHAILLGMEVPLKHLKKQVED